MSHDLCHTVTIKSEADIPRGWRYRVEIIHPDKSRTEHRVRMAWVDHNHWAADRAIPPSTIVRAVLACVLAHREGDSPLPDRFDAALARRWVPGIDQELDRFLA